MKDLWVHGAMPVELLLIQVFTLILFVAGNHFLKRSFGKGISMFFQGILFIFSAYFIFKYVLFPPIPSALLYTYMGLILLAVFLYLSSTDDSWREFKDPIIKTLEGKTQGFKAVRLAAFFLIPIIAGLGVYNFLMPSYQEPFELRNSHPAPPASIQVHGVTMNLQTARSPFRVDEQGKYSEGIQYKYRNANLYGQ